MAKEKERKAIVEEVTNGSDIALNAAIDAINKQFGKGAIMRLDKDAPIEDVEFIPTGSFGLDNALGVGGVPRGRIIEIFGPESSGKTTLSLQVIAEAQKMGATAAFVDAEHALDMAYAKRLGVDPNKLLMAQPDSGEQALEIVETLVRSGSVAIIVVDSVAALTPLAEINGEMGDSVTGDTPIVIRKNEKHISIVSIASLYGGTYKFFGKRYSNRYKKLKNIEILTSNGWKKATCIVLKNNKDKKPIVVTNTLNGAAQTTKDHSLFVNGIEKSPSELKIGDLLDIKKPESSNNLIGITEDIAWIIGYFCAEGSKRTENVFAFSDTTEAHIDMCMEKLNKNFTVYTKKDKIDKNDGVRKSLFRLYTSGDMILSSILNQCIDEKIKEKRIPDAILNGSETIKKSFLEGYKVGDGVIKFNEYSFSTSSFLMLAGISYIFDCLGFKYHINSNYRVDRNNKVEFNITQVLTDNIKNTNEITKFIEIPAPKYLYDIETEDGTFVGGAGCIVHHNSHMGLQARLMSQALRKLTAITSKSNTTIIFINQLRQKIGVMFGNPETTPGGNALKFYCSVRIDIRRLAAIKDGDAIIGNRVKVKVVKNKVSPPFKECEFDLLYGKGVNKLGEIVDLSENHGIIEKSGAWYKYNGTNIGQGRDNTIEYLENNKNVRLEIESKLKEIK